MSRIIRITFVAAYRAFHIQAMIVISHTSHNCQRHPEPSCMFRLHPYWWTMAPRIGSPLMHYSVLWKIPLLCRIYSAKIILITFVFDAWMLIIHIYAYTAPLSHFLTFSPVHRPRSCVVRIAKKQKQQKKSLATQWNLIPGTMKAHIIHFGCNMVFAYNNTPRQTHTMH